MKTSKEIIGYKLANPRFKEVAMSALNQKCFLNAEIAFYKDSNAYRKAKHLLILDRWFTPVYKEEPELNRWYKDKDKFGEGMIFFANEITEDEDVLGYGIAQDEWCECGIWGEADNFTGVPATDAEVEAALIQEARSRGFKEGVEVKYIGGTGTGIIENYPEHEFRSSVNDFFYRNILVFANGKWAEIIDQPKKENIVIFPKHLEGKLTIKYQ